MPIYEFKCNRCGHTFEQLILSSRDEKSVTCSSCGEGDTTKLMSSFSCGSGGIGKAVSSAGASACSPSPRGFS